MLPKFIFSDVDACHDVYVRVIESPQDSVGESLLDLRGDHQEGWKITKVHPTSLLVYIPQTRFQTKEMATDFVYALRAACKKVSEKAPLPVDLVHYLDERTRELSGQEEHAVSQLIQVRREFHTLARLAERGQIKAKPYLNYSTSEESLLEELLDFEVNVEGKNTPLISESALYHLIGKDEARTFLSLFKKVARVISPRMAETKL